MIYYNSFSRNSHHYTTVTTKTINLTSNSETKLNTSNAGCYFGKCVKLVMCKIKKHSFSSKMTVNLSAVETFGLDETDPNCKLKYKGKYSLILK